LDDAVADGNKAFNVILGATSSSDATYDMLNPDDVSFLNVDDDAPASR